jgi:hypothetical protein
VGKIASMKIWPMTNGGLAVAGGGLAVHSRAAAKEICLAIFSPWFV